MRISLLFPLKDLLGGCSTAAMILGVQSGVEGGDLIFSNILIYKKFIPIDLAHYSAKPVWESAQIGLLAGVLG
jgi:hypothetical protein